MSTATAHQVPEIKNDPTLKDPVCDRAEAERFLNRLDPTAKSFTFQTFCDSKTRKDPKLSKVIHASIDDCFEELSQLNADGAGVFVSVNQTNLTGRSKTDMVRVRAMFREDDGDASTDLPLTPQITIQSSPGKKHEYLLTHLDLINDEGKLIDTAIEEFDAVLRRVIDDFGSDPCAKSVTRVLRTPGFFHMKDPDRPHLVRVVQMTDAAPYSWAKIKEALPPVLRAIPQARFSKIGPPPLDLKFALDMIDANCSYDDWIIAGMALHHATNGSQEGFDLWNDWSKTGENYPDSAGETAYKWDSFAGNQGPTVTVKSVYKMARDNGWKGLSYPDLTGLISALDHNDPVRTSTIIDLISTSNLNEVEREFLLKSVKKHTGCSLGSLRKSMNIARSNRDENDEMMICRKVREQIGTDNLIFSKSCFYRWSESGVWLTEEDISVRQAIQVYCETEDHCFTASFVDSVKRLLATAAYIRGHEFDCQNDFINCKTGELHFVDGQWELRPFEKRSYRTTQIPVQYDPEARCPRFQKFLDEIFEGETDHLERKKILLEMIGYSLLSSTKFEKFIVLIGSGANGKSVVLNVLQGLLGPKQVSGVRLSQFGNQFQLGHLHRKLANVVSELPEGAVLQDAEIKKIVSGELVTAEHKNKDPFDFRPYATCWLATNHLPHCRDHTQALFRRAIVLSFNRTFKGDEIDHQLSEKLLDELPGIFYLATGAIARVLTSNRFTHCPSSDKALMAWRLESDHVMQYFQERCKKEKGASTRFAVLYGDYKGHWAPGSGIRNICGRNNFIKRLKGQGIPYKKTNKGEVLRGYSLKRP